MKAVIFMKYLFSPLSEEAFGMVRDTLCVSCVMLFCSVMVLLHIGALTPRTYALYRLSSSVTPQPSFSKACAADRNSSRV